MKIHLSLPSAKLDESVSFYRTLLGAEPRKHHADYALFVVDDPGLELALDADPTTRVAADGSHFGIAVAGEEAVEAAIERLAAAGLAAVVERDTTCCYARQTKVWTSDPDGRRWEVYFVYEETAQRDAADGSCCTEATCPEFAECCAS
jgi:catechol 2,3-dioxygenase-like lactoylglutathione lyase family enzyme